MELKDFSPGAAWAIDHHSFEGMQAMAAGLPADRLAKAFEENPPGVKDVAVQEGVAIIPVYGPISQKTTWLTAIFGGTGLDQLGPAFGSALIDNRVKAIVFDIDSPGGTIGGIAAFADLIFQARGKKPMVAFASGYMASAAYWIGSAADAVIADKTAMVGSIGVVTVHADLSEADKRSGIKRTVLTAGKYKAIGNNAEPLSKEAGAVIQSELDYIYSVFIDSVARNRSVAVSSVLKNMADGRIFIGRQALDAGLVDQVGSLSTALAATSNGLQKRPASPGGTRGYDGNERERLLELVSAVFGKDPGTRFRALYDAGVTAQMHIAVEAAQLPGGDQELDGLAAAVTAIKASVEKEMGGRSAGGGDFLALVADYRRMHGCSRVEAMQAVMKTNPGAHRDYIRRSNPGLYR